MHLPCDEELLAYLDGEVDAPRREEISRLLRLSPALNERLAAIRRDVGAFDEIFAEAQPPIPSAEALWPELRDRVESRSHRRALWAGIAAAACICVGFYLRVSSTPSISANDVLARAGKAEAALLEKIAAPVVHRRLHISARGRAATLETWTTTSGQSRQRFESGGEKTFQAELDRVLALNRMDRRYLLSASAYREWRKGLHGSDETLVRGHDEQGADIYSIATTLPGTAEGQIIRSEFVVRATDWQPIANHLRVRTAEGEADYEIHEVEYAVVARASLPEGYFDPPARPVLAARAPVKPLPEPAPAPPAPLSIEPPASPDDEIDAHYAVHRAGACDGDPLIIRRTAGGLVEVNGSVSDPERGRRIEMFVDGLASVRLNLHTAPRPPAAAPATTPASSPEAEALRLSIDSFVTLIASDAAALRELVPVSRRSQEASPAAREHLREMLQEHLEALDGNMHQVALLLDASAAASASTGDPAADWPAQAAEVAEAAARLAAGYSPDAVSWANLSAQAHRARVAVSAALQPQTASAAR